VRYLQGVLILLLLSLLISGSCGLLKIILFCLAQPEIKPANLHGLRTQT